MTNFVLKVQDGQDQNGLFHSVLHQLDDVPSTYKGANLRKQLAKEGLGNNRDQLSVS